MAWLKNIGHRDTKESKVVAKQLPSNGLGTRRKRLLISAHVLKNEDALNKLTPRSVVFG